jgi:hypothetical protein
MAFRVCCSCSNAVANGYWLRHSRITSTTLNDIGDEEAAWTAINDVHYRVTDSGSPWAAGSIKLCYGVRYETFMPSADNDLWPMFESSGAQIQYFPVTQPRLGWRTVGGVPANAGSIYNTPPSTFTRSALRETCHPDNHVSNQPITHLVLPFSEIGLFNSSNLAARIRPRYYRILNNGIPITGILSAIEENSFSVRPSADVLATNATGTPDNTTKYANLTSDTNDASFVYTTDNTVGTYRTRLATVTAPGYRGDHVLHYRIGASKNGVVVGIGDTGNAVSVTVALKRSTTVLVQETRTVPADWTTYTLAVPLSALSGLAASAYSQLIVEIVTTASGGSGGSQRGCALAFAKLTFSDSWTPSNWSYNITSNTQVASAGTSTGYIPNSIVSTWKLPPSADKWIFKRNILFGIDVWYEIYKLSSVNTVKLGTGSGSVSTTAPTEGYSDGAFGVGAYFNSGFDPTKHTYKLTFNGGYLRPDEALGDEYIFASDQKPATSVTNGENALSSVLSTHATGTWHYYVRFCRVVFVWACEIPVIELHTEPYDNSTTREIITYVPENTTSEIEYLKRSRSSGAPFDFGYQQNGLGNWEAPTTSTFVRCYTPVVNTTGTFTDQSDSLYPTSITVERIQAVAKRVWHGIRATTNNNPYLPWTSAWIVPVGVSELIVECWGAGGGSSNIYTGGGGAYARKTFTVTQGQSIAFEVGGAGLSDATAPFDAQTDGGATWFMSTTDCFADGGKAGNNATTSYGTGGQASSSYGDVKYSGRNSAAGVYASSGGYDTHGVNRNPFTGIPSLGKKVDIFGAGAFSGYNAQFGGIMIHYTLPITPPSVWTYTQTTTWQCPTGITEVEVECWAGGGGGGATDDYSGSAAGGGGGGAYSKKTITVVPDTIYTVTVGRGGDGGVDGNLNGQDGEDSWFSTSSTILAKGGLRGTGATLDDDEAGGAGGSAASGIGTTKYSGGDGAAGLSTSYGGGGGSSAGPEEDGDDATNGTGALASILGGGGGNGTTADDGGVPGGGGGGAVGTASADTPIRPGGAGGRGKIRITQVI